MEPTYLTLTNEAAVLSLDKPTDDSITSTSKDKPSPQDSPMEGQGPWLQLNTAERDDVAKDFADMTVSTSSEAARDIPTPTQSETPISPGQELGLLQRTETQDEENPIELERTRTLNTSEFTSRALEKPAMYTMKDVSSHNTTTDMWLVIDSEVYDVTDFHREHPGGAKILAGIAGKDATKKFDKYHRRGLLDQYRPRLRIGVLDFPEAMTTSRRRFLQKIGLRKGSV